MTLNLDLKYKEIIEFRVQYIKQRGQANTYYKI